MGAAVFLTVLCLLRVHLGRGRQATQLFVYSEVYTWPEAASACVGKGGRLATIDSAASALLKRLHASSDYRHTSTGKMWIGLRKWTRECNTASRMSCFKWSDCSSWDKDGQYNGFPTTANTTVNNNNNNSDSTTSSDSSYSAACVAMVEDETMVWTAEDCDSKLSYVCQVDLGDCCYENISASCVATLISTNATTMAACQADCDNDDNCWMYEMAGEGEGEVGCRLCIGDSPFVYELSSSARTVTMKTCFGAVTYETSSHINVTEKGEKVSAVNCTQTFLTTSLPDNATTGPNHQSAASTQGDVNAKISSATVPQSVPGDVPHFLSRSQTVVEETQNSSVAQTTERSNDGEISTLTDTQPTTDEALQTTARQASNRVTEYNVDGSSDSSNAVSVTTVFQQRETSTAEAEPDSEGTALPQDVMTTPGVINVTEVLQSRARLCPCACVRGDLMTSANVSDVTCDLIAELTVNRSSLSSERRKRTSAPDPRVSSQTIGWFGVTLVTSVVATIVVPDLVRLLKFLTRGSR